MRSLPIRSDACQTAQNLALKFKVICLLAIRAGVLNRRYGDRAESIGRQSARGFQVGSGIWLGSDDAGQQLYKRIHLVPCNLWHVTSVLSTVGKIFPPSNSWPVGRPTRLLPCKTVFYCWRATQPLDIVHSTQIISKHVVLVHTLLDAQSLIWLSLRS